MTKSLEFASTHCNIEKRYFIGKESHNFIDDKVFIRTLTEIPRKKTKYQKKEENSKSPRK